MKFKTINWKQHPDYQTVYQGMIGEQELFTITDISNKNISNFKLQSANPKSNSFHYCTTLKFLGEFRTLELAKVEAQIKWEEFTNGLLQIEEMIPVVTNSELVS